MFLWAFDSLFVEKTYFLWVLGDLYVPRWNPEELPILSDDSYLIIHDPSLHPLRLFDHLIDLRFICRMNLYECCFQNIINVDKNSIVPSILIGIIFFKAAIYINALCIGSRFLKTDFVRFPNYLKSVLYTGAKRRIHQGCILSIFYLQSCATISFVLEVNSTRPPHSETDFLSLPGSSEEISSVTTPASVGLK